MEPNNKPKGSAAKNTKAPNNKAKGKSTSPNLIRGQGHPEDIASRIFWGNNEFFAEVFNKIVFKQDIITPSSLHDTTEAEKAMLRFNNGTMRMGLFRDLAKRWGMGEHADAYFALIAMENQTHIDYTMPYRTFAMDAINYGGQVSSISKDRGKEYREKAKESGNPMTDDEFFCHFRKTDRICPVVPLVVYYGDNPWDGPRCLKDMFMDSPVKDFANDYPMHLLDVKHMSDEELDLFSEPLRTCLGMLRISGHKEIKKFIDENAQVLNSLPQQTWNALLDMTDSRSFFLPAKPREEEGGNNVCKGLQLWGEEREMITTIRVGKDHGFSKEIVVADLVRYFKDLDEKGAKEVVEKFWDSKEVNS